MKHGLVSVFDPCFIRGRPPISFPNWSLGTRWGSGDDDFPAADGVETENRPQRFRSPRAHDPGDAEDFTPMQLQTYTAWQLSPGQVG